ncbi:methyl-accepting chemotaxis protein [Neisseriaceae bacterium TC5R-5]|nr:methyl-accepting chemotaxis protein [Neisseriaceae bacterium TC5R-5]
MSISQRIMLLLLVSLSSLLALGGYGLWQQQQAKARFDNTLNNLIPSIRDLNVMTGSFIDIRSGLIRYTLARSAEDKQAALSAIQKADKAMDERLENYEKNNLANDKDRELLQKDGQALVRLREAIQKLLAVADQNDPIATNNEFNNGAIVMATRDFRQAIDQHMEFNYALSLEFQQANTDAFNAALWSMGISILVVGLLILTIGTQIFRGVKRGLASIQNTLQQVSTTLDFTQRAPILRMDEIGHTATAFNSLLVRLQDNLKSLLQGAHSVARASEALNETSGQVASAAASQSASSASVAASVEQMTVSVNHVADRAQETHHLATNAGKLASDGSTTIAETINDIRQISRAVDEAAMSIRELDKFSIQVNAVVSVIKDIADQTNLLALNASIEAARAGEMGRGFAVVADEVRMLAERTTSSTKEISTTLSSMQERSKQANTQMGHAETLVKNSVERADAADSAIKSIGESTGDTVNMVADISSAIKQQGAATNGIAVQIESIAQMSEEASSAAQETANNAQQLDKLARCQIETLSQYHL